MHLLQCQTVLFKHEDQNGKFLSHIANKKERGKKRGEKKPHQKPEKHGWFSFFPTSHESTTTLFRKQYNFLVYTIAESKRKFHFSSHNETVKTDFLLLTHKLESKIT